MKKVFALICVAAVAVSMMACGGKKEEPAKEAQVESVVEEAASEVTEPIQNKTVTGGWTVHEGEGMTTMPEDVATAWAGGIMGTEYEEYTAIALLGTQVVAGQNYMFLARSPKDEGEQTAILVTIVIYADLEGNCELLSVTPFNLAAYTSSENSGTDPESGLAGGFTVFEDIDKIANVEDDYQKVFDKAMEGMGGVGYTPISVLGTQVVAGENVAYLAKGTMVAAEPITNVYVVSVYADLEDNAEVNNVCILNLGDLTE